MCVMRMTAGNDRPNAQKREHVLAPRFVQGAEDFIEYEQGERLPRPLGDHLGDRQTQDEIRNVLLPHPRSRLGHAFVEHDHAIVLVQVHLVVARVGEVGQEPGRQSADLGRMAAFSSARRSENARSSSLWSRSSILRPAMVRSRAARSAARRSVSRTALFGRDQLRRASRPRQLRGPQRVRGAIVAVARGLEISALRKNPSACTASASCV